MCCIKYNVCFLKERLGLLYTHLSMRKNAHNSLPYRRG